MSIKYAILGLLHYRDMHGYRIKEHIERHFGHMWTINYGQLYPALKSMQEEGLIDMVEVAPSDNGGPNKKLYKITGKGKEAFQGWLHSKPERQMFLRDPFLMRFLFFGFGDADKSLQVIDEQIRVYEDQMKMRRQNMSRWRRQESHVRLIAELGLSLNEMYLQWLLRAREEIASNMKSKES
jgi:DNA-binding PadR family transcriptional regulator